MQLPCQNIAIIILFLDYIAFKLYYCWDTWNIFCKEDKYFAVLVWYQRKNCKLEVSDLSHFKMPNLKSLAPRSCGFAFSLPQCRTVKVFRNPKETLCESHEVDEDMIRCTPEPVSLESVHCCLKWLVHWTDKFCKFSLANQLLICSYFFI